MPKGKPASTRRKEFMMQASSALPVFTPKSKIITFFEVHLSLMITFRRIGGHSLVMESEVAPRLHLQSKQFRYQQTRRPT